MTAQENARPRGLFRRLRRAGAAKARPLMNPYQSFFYDACNVLLRAAFRLLTSVEIVGLDNVPRQGQIIVIGNHTSYLDPVLVGAFIPRRIVFMSKKENLTNPIARFVIYSYGVFPVDRGNVDRSALGRTDEVLEAGGALGMFPEGTRSRTGELRRAKAGTALVALRHNAPILPIAIAGAQHGVFGQLLRLRRPRLRMVIGRPFTLPQTEGEAISKDVLTRLTDDLMRPLAANLPQEQRGYYGGAEARHPAERT
jgi:1-acyl-sn-glycerol-3-phosphate acyltransferase